MLKPMQLGENQRLRIAVISVDRNDRNRLNEIESKLQCQTCLNANGIGIDNVFKQVIEVTATSAIKVQYEQQYLYFVDDIACAKLKLHPHAYLCGFATTTSKIEAQARALLQSKRKPEHAVKFESDVPFSGFLDAINALASRTLTTQSGQNNYWFMPQHQPRVLQLDFEVSGRYSSLILVQGTECEKAKPLLNSEQLFFVICGNSIDDVVAQAKQCQIEIASSQEQNNNVTLNDRNLSRYNPNTKLALVLQAKNIPQLVQELQLFFTAVLNNQNQENWRWQTPNGSCFFVGEHLNRTGLTFVYPGVGTTYSNMLSELHEFFPTLYQELDKQLDLAAMLQAESYYSDDVLQPTLSQQAISGVGVSYLFTRLLINEFKVTPDFALGYSMGESAMWASLNIWNQPETLIEKTATSDIFNQQISGELQAVRSEWQLKANEHINWNSFVVRASAAEIGTLTRDYPKVYLVITQGETCVIAGDEHQCKALLQQLGKRGLASNMVTAMHTPASKRVKPQLTEFYTLPLIAAASKTQFISASSNKIINGRDNHAIAKSIATTFTEPLDFSQTIETAKQHGGNIFLEVGADRQTASIIEKITKNDTETHCLAINSKGQPTITSLLKCIAQLISLRIPISIVPLLHCKEKEGSASVHE
ncbi:PfaB family protein [Shewanella sp. OPT22]|nr:PfaB family protein [Shewanella sp. OPT22]